MLSKPTIEEALVALEIRRAELLRANNDIFRAAKLGTLLSDMAEQLKSIRKRLQCVEAAQTELQALWEEASGIRVAHERA